MASNELKISMLNSILASPKFSKSRVLSMHRQRLYLETMNTEGFISGLKWVDGCKINDASDDTFILVTRFKNHFDYCTGLIAHFPAALRPYLIEQSNNDSECYVQLICKKTVPFTVLEDVAKAFPVIGQAAKGKKAKKLKTEVIKHPHTGEELTVAKGRAPVFLDKNNKPMGFFFTSSQGASAQNEVNKSYASTLMDRIRNMFR